MGRSRRDGLAEDVGQAPEVLHETRILAGQNASQQCFDAPSSYAGLLPADVDGSLHRAAEVAPVVSRFFDDVMVVAEDERVRGNRLRMLLELRDRLGRLGDLSQIPR